MFYQLRDVFHSSSALIADIKRLQIALISQEKDVFSALNVSLNFSGSPYYDVSKSEKRIKELVICLETKVNGTWGSNANRSFENEASPPLLDFCNEITNGINEVTSHLSSSSQQLSALIKEVENNKQLISVVEKMITRKQNLEINLNKHNTNLQDKVIEIQQLQNQNTTMALQISDLKAQLINVTTQLNESDSKYKEKLTEVETHNMEKLSLHKQLSDLEQCLKLEEVKVTTLQSEKQAQLLNIDEMSIENSHLIESRADVENQLQSAFAQLDNEQAKSDQLQRDLNNLKEHCQTISENLVSKEQLNLQLTDHVMNLKTNVADLTSNHDAVRKEIENISEMKSRLEKDLELSSQASQNEKKILRYYLL